jgi:hypothetical protein
MGGHALAGAGDREGRRGLALAIPSAGTLERLSSGQERLQ